MTFECILCRKSAILFFTAPKTHKEYYHCSHCDLRFLHPKFRLDPTAESTRYLSHNNDVLDPAYQNFVKPLYDLVLKNCPVNSLGLDFGSGTGPVLSYLLTLQGYCIDCFDPYFKKDSDYLSKRYDFIASVEVVEHFYFPDLEFKKLRSLLVDGGSLGIMTLLYDDKIGFASWYYKNDPTHVCFYSKNTFEWIRNIFDFKECEFYGNRTIWLTA